MDLFFAHEPLERQKLSSIEEVVKSGRIQWVFLMIEKEHGSLAGSAA